MRLVTDTALGLALAAGAVMLGTSPAAAEIARAQRDVTFTHGGRSVTCTVHGSSELDQDTDVANRPYSTLSYGVSVTGSDPACRTTLVGVGVVATYRREGASADEQSRSSSTGSDVSGTTVIRDAYPSSATVAHSAEFDCDDHPQPEGCVTTLHTDPLAASSK
jgi:hypothetical protein